MLCPLLHHLSFIFLTNNTIYWTLIFQFDQFSSVVSLLLCKFPIIYWRSGWQWILSIHAQKFLIEILTSNSFFGVALGWPAAPWSWWVSLWSWSNISISFILIFNRFLVLLDFLLNIILFEVIRYFLVTIMNIILPNFQRAAKLLGVLDGLTCLEMTLLMETTNKLLRVEKCVLLEFWLSVLVATHVIFVLFIGSVWWKPSLWDFFLIFLRP